ncbi:MAG: hydrogenase maturation protease [Archaeoglobaceae archaeon]
MNIDYESNMILVLGLGNPVLSDDAIGLRVVEALQNRELDGVDAREGSSDLDIFEGLTSYEYVIFVDAVESGGEPGTVYEASLSQIEPKLSTHNFDLNLVKYLESVEGGGPQVILLAVEAGDIQTISEKCTPEVEEAISKILNTVETLSMKLNYQNQQKV